MSSETTVFITAGEDIICRNILATPFWSFFIDYVHAHQLRVVVLTTPTLAATVTRIVGSDATVVSYSRTPPSRFENVIMTLARSSINSHTNTWSKMRSYLRGDSGFVATYLKRGLTALIGGSAFWKRFVRACIKRLPADEHPRELFKEYRPEIFIPLSLTNFEFDVPLAREARRRGVPIIGMVRSWDNLSSHGLLRVVPDVFVLQNEFLKEMAAEYQDIHENKTPISIVGVPQYDTSVSHPLSREELFGLLGLDVNKKLIVYGAMGEFLFPAEHSMPKVLDRIIQHEGLADSVQVLFRTHPKFMPGSGYGTFRTVIVYTPQSYTASEREYSNERVLMSTIQHADLILTGASTIALDATVLGKPLICIAFDGEMKVRYWESAARFFDCFTHFEDFVTTSGVSVARSEAELQTWLVQQVSSGAQLGYDRDAVLKRFIGETGHAGKRLAATIAHAIETALKKRHVA